MLRRVIGEFLGTGLLVAVVVGSGLMAHKNHVGYYPYSGSVISKFPEISEKYKTTKGALQMPIDKPLAKPSLKTSYR